MPKQNSINVALPAELHTKIKAIAEKNGQKMTWIVSQAVIKWLAKVDNITSSRTNS